MLLNFKIKNFRSFRDETIFTMIPSSKKMHGEYIIKYCQDTIKALPAAVIYGANASGKSNIILAMYLLRKIVLFGNLDIKEIFPFIDTMPFIHDKKYYDPTEFEITFTQNNKIYKYGLGIKTSMGQRSITTEYLIIDDEQFFTRDTENGVKVFVHELIKNKRIEKGDENFYNILLEKMNKNLDSKQLFLFSGIKNLIGNDYFNDIQQWFMKFNVIMNASDVSFKQKDLENIERKSLSENEEIANRKFYKSNSIEEIIKFAEFGNQSVQFISEAEKDDLSMISLYKLPEKNDGDKSPVGMIINSEFMESRGMIQLIKLVQPFIDALKSGGVIVLDEMDASLHFEIVVSLLRIFNNSALNCKGAQLIFNTHNPIYLDGELLRHDQIIMVEKNKKSLVSEIYALSDYGLRPEERILKNYLNGKYGALPHMDLEIAFRNILEKEAESYGATSE